MRIAMVLNSPVWGGLERYTVDLALGLAAKGHEVHVLATPDGPVAERLSGSTVVLHSLDLGLIAGYHASIGPLNAPLFFVDLRLNPLRRRLSRALDEIAAEAPIDVLHAQHVKEKLWVTDEGQRRGVPVAWTVHAPLEPWMTKGIPGAVHRHGIGRVGGIVAVNESARQDYVDYGYDAAATTTVHNGIRLSDYVDGDRDGTREQLHIRGDEIVILLPARPYEAKGVGTLLEATKRLRSDSWSATGGRALRVLVAGESRHVGTFRERAQAMGLGPHVDFLGQRDDMPDLYAAADVVTLPSFNEGLPYVIMEAMAARRVVVASDVGGIPEMIDDGASGLLVRPGDARGLADALALLARDPEMRDELATKGAAVAATRFELSRMVDESEAALAAIAEGRGL